MARWEKILADKSIIIKFNGYISWKISYDKQLDVWSFDKEESNLKLLIIYI